MKRPSGVPRTALGLALLAAGLATSLPAQSASGDTTAARAGWVGPQVGPLIGLHWDRLQLVTFSSGSASLWCRDNDPSRSILCAGGFVLASPGWYGGELTIGALAIGQVFRPVGFVAVAPGVSFLRTWNGSPRAANTTTYWGPRVRLVALPVGVSVGWYRRISGPTGTFDRVWTLSVGVGLP